MGTVFLDYELLVLADYHQKKVDNHLPKSLMFPTPAKLKAECVRLCAKEVLKKDEKTIRDFCEESIESKTCLQAIKKCSRDKFKPLSNFLKGITERTDETNIELLAFLTGFGDRPYEFDKVYPPPKEVEKTTIKKVGPEVDNSVDSSKSDDSPLVNGKGEAETDTNINTSVPEPPPTPAPALESDAVGASKKGIKFGPRQTLAAATVLVGISMAFWFGGNKGFGGCMYWAGDHYQAIPCNEQPAKANTLVIPLDTIKVKYFKRIMQPDTIARTSIGTIWYSKINNEVEFYTAAGYHPVTISRKLKPLSEFMYDKYILHKVTSP